MAQGNTLRLLRALDPRTLRRVARVYRASPGVESLAALPQLDVSELLRHVLRKGELALAARELGVEPLGTREQLARRLARLLRWPPFEEARAAARALGLSKYLEWRELSRRRGLPDGLPSMPDQVYADAGWAGWGDFLGTGNKGMHDYSYRPFAEARAFARALGLRSSPEWLAWCREERPDLPPRPEDIPTNPHRTYREEWQGMGDWLGTGAVAKHLREYRSCAATRRLARTLGLESQNEWYAWTGGGRPDLPARPGDVPFHPDRTYADEWTSWGDFLGTGSVATTRRSFRRFAAARAYVRALGLTGQEEWHAWCRGELPGKPARPLDVPTNPHRIYAGRGWVDLGDWLGTGRVATTRRSYWGFEKARAFVRDLGLRSQDEYRRWCQGELPGKPPRPEGVPTNPWRSYADEWVSMNDWLGKAPGRGHRWRSFAEARAFARSLGLPNQKAWKAWAAGRRPELPEKPADVPASPEPIYRGRGWDGWSDWLGSG